MTPTTAPFVAFPFKVTTTLAVPVAGAKSLYIAVFALLLLVWAPTGVKSVAPYFTDVTVLSLVEIPTSINRSVPEVVCEIVITLLVVVEPVLTASTATWADNEPMLSKSTKNHTNPRRSFCFEVILLVFLAGKKIFFISYIFKVLLYESIIIK